MADQRIVHMHGIGHTPAQYLRSGDLVPRNSPFLEDLGFVTRGHLAAVPFTLRYQLMSPAIRLRDLLRAVPAFSQAIWKPRSDNASKATSLVRGR